MGSLGRRARMRTPFTGVGTALVTPFTQSGELDEAAVRRLGAAADRRRHPLPGARAARPARTRRSPTAERAADRRDPRRRSRRARCRCWPAPAATTRREVIAPRRRDAQGAAPSGFLSVTPYYNKPTQEGLVPALPRDRREHAAADRRLQRAGPHRRQRRAGHARPPGARFRTSSASRKRRAT